ncbi:vanadium-dependent haloperoxidase [Alteromonas sp. CI.11.F.A3]|uniref:vanadium-dependent haloperoxidase n=1 Tax=Alteromonas sp. CI.11.F.A3 TaxID=3079555 RepID=UPI0029424978|nr:vanadium-dependent haloperoxidase [Alteromonas sp. CI.11.F.A3]WOI38647.1 vanadium-dependent haloperoxidase [Alteromonas sp. CI.11.F.A3]
MALPEQRSEQEQRIIDSEKVRINAAQVARQRIESEYGPLSPAETIHKANSDEMLTSKSMSFTKGLQHNELTGLLSNEDDFVKFVKGINTGNPHDILDTPIGTTVNYKWRGWESSAAGLTYDLQGPDSHSVTMPAPPGLENKDELSAEIGEVYAQALLRDAHFAAFSMNENVYKKFVGQELESKRVKTKYAHVESVVECLNRIPFFASNNARGPFTPVNAFRGISKGDLDGPYLSQFLLTGDNGLNNKNDGSPEHDACDGIISYGAQTINQKVRNARSDDYLTDWSEWLDIQNGGDARGCEKYVGDQRRFITTPRDLATYVHYDALYQAYLNACLLLLNVKAPLGESIPYAKKEGETDVTYKQQGFALYGGPHILSLVTEVATRALKAVRYQKFNLHRRLRPEALAARLEKCQAYPASFEPQFAEIREVIESSGLADKLDNSLLLPMAFAEGSPMHPSYGAGHATVAGACVTILKAFFDGSCFLHITNDGERFSVDRHSRQNDNAFIPSSDGRRLRVVEVSQSLSLEGELNKLAANISIGRDWAGVHYYSDYEQSLLMGEKIAISMLQEQTLGHNPLENLAFTLNRFDGSEVVITEGQVH